MTDTLRLRRADYSNPAHAQALVDLLDSYARDPSGGAEPLSDFTKANLPAALQARPNVFSVLAFDDAQGGQPVGLINCVEGFSTFACRPLVNIHDVVVAASHRGQGIGEQMLGLVEQIARERGACKLTLEVLSGNAPASRLYHRIGFDNYQLEPSMGNALFMQKWL
ncbi:GNAT family N-acetyltransferase [Rhodoferax antarcticus]|uniref:GNAT family acetyltransferase n=1 Tax=Rhodoferax antarcticus ANT.BR TaxID=1111071 RepID=A0A1Q8YC26_9BURK|nr:GNAT family N-acetyltransferase [Rhodoferax antarcticus]APW46857.1 GNAT family N-acetyltransferase [Rhodoferax antarcticus]MCW2311350.1 ribosomal protein S18 acetylase RimI-like enzyme [Rhodoferax antarcticus]OLP05370.1 GNAT family acetyltransferase [Rhodoferax antarcticus ANT.BR]